MTKIQSPHALTIGAALALLVTASPALAQTHASTAHAPVHARVHEPVGARVHAPVGARVHAATTHAPPPSHATTHADDPSGVVNIQTASAEQLQLLPGIGPSKADAIIRFRTTHPFGRVEDILRVRGIGRVTFRRLRPMITVSGGTTMTSDVHTPRAAATDASTTTAPSE